MNGAATLSSLPTDTASRPLTPAELTRRLLTPAGDWGATAARLALAGVMFPHGAQKVLGWFGGFGLEGTWGYMTGQLGIPAPFAALAIGTEFLAPLALALGLLARPAAAGIAAIMAVAALTVHASNGFFMNWFGNQAGEGFEYHILAFALAAVVMINGGGRLALDRRLAQALER